MNIAEYIESGVIEAYVSGIASEAEVRELEQLMLQYPELKQAVLESQSVMEQYATMHQKEVPSGLKNVIREQLLSEGLITTTRTSSVQETKAPVVAAKRSIPVWALAASLVLLIASAAGNMLLLNEQQHMKSEIEHIAALQKNTIQERDQALAKSESMQKAMSILELPKLKKISLAGVTGHEGHNGMLYWDGATGDVFLDLAGMPAAPEGKQYQLWAIVDGKPVDAGVYDGNPDTLMQQMKTIAKAEMFAITIERKGGSPNPTLDQMVVAGKTS